MLYVEQVLLLVALVASRFIFDHTISRYDSCLVNRRSLQKEPDPPPQFPEVCALFFAVIRNLVYCEDGSPTRMKFGRRVFIFIVSSHRSHFHFCLKISG